MSSLVVAPVAAARVAPVCRSSCGRTGGRPTATAVASVDEVDTEQTRLADLGLASVDERGTTCCYAEQDEFWVEGTPGGERWEVYTVLADSPTFAADPAPGETPTCCGTPPPRCGSQFCRLLGGSSVS